ncbi:hypothetical protein LTR53_005540 [Teratosphaeriaceae sp. CCFEE 6253]|nr:hypothetical protein LTR53_005540 [Teratosphaeriaceae sp. CCFEE 6253]
MHPPAGLAALLLGFAASFFATTVSTTPVRHSPPPPAQPDAGQQRFLPPGWGARLPKSHRANTHLDAAPNSVGMLFTSADNDEVVHIWLPLGRRVFTRDWPELPLHPVTARITTLIRSTPRIATPEHLDQIVCRIYPHYNQTAEEREAKEELVLEVRRRDGLVHLADLSERVWREVEGFECS